MRPLFLSVLCLLFAFAPTAQANGRCGGVSQRECTVFEQIPSCDRGLTARSGTCHACGGKGELACAITVQVPSCDRGLIEKGGRCASPPPPPTCGAEGQRPCRVWERIPSCDSGLAEDFLARECVPSGPAALRAHADQVVADAAPVLKMAVVAATCTLSGHDVQRLVELTQAGDAASLQRWADGSSCIEQVLQTAADGGYDTVTFGVGGGGAAVVGVSSELGVALHVLGREPARTYATVGFTSGIGVGVDVSVIVSLYKVRASELAGDAQGFVYSAAAATGGGAAVWYDPQGRQIGLSGFVSVGAEGQAAVFTGVTTAVYGALEGAPPAATAPVVRPAPAPVDGPDVAAIRRVQRVERARASR